MAADGETLSTTWSAPLATRPEAVAIPMRRWPVPFRSYEPLPANLATTPSSTFSVVAHELRGPVTALLAASQILTQDLDHLDTGQIRGMVGTLERQALWLQGLLENLLYFEQARAGGLHHQRQPFAVIEVVREAAGIIEPLLEKRGQQLRISGDRDPGELWGDPRRIGQVLINLVINASKFSDRGSPIDIRLLASEGTLQVRVADRGPGLPAVDSERLFEPFYRAPNVLAGTEGIGLGLGIVKLIVEAHSGRVGAENRPDGGAVFWFELPIAPQTMMEEEGDTP